MSILIVLGVLVLAALLSGVKWLYEYERGVIFTLGRLRTKPKGPGLIYVWPLIQRIYRVSLRTIVLDVPSQDIITRDNVSVKVNAVVYFRVIDPNKAVAEVENYLYATSQLSQTTLRSVCGEAELDELLSHREKINMKLQEILDKHTDPWGIKVSAVELKHIDLPQEMQRAMARQAEAERERRAKVISAEGEYQASQRLAEASDILKEHPLAIQLRFLQTVTEIATERNSTTIFPVPIEMFTPFIYIMQQQMSEIVKKELKKESEDK